LLLPGLSQPLIGRGQVSLKLAECLPLTLISSDRMSICF
jgi:tRNA A37 N6-isopentenylltransferase MiaA